MKQHTVKGIRSLPVEQLRQGDCLAVLGADVAAIFSLFDVFGTVELQPGGEVQRVAAASQELGLQLLLLFLCGQGLLLLFDLLPEALTFGADLLLQLLTPAGQISLQCIELLCLRPPVGQHVGIRQIRNTGAQGLQLGGLGPQKAIGGGLLRFLRRWCCWCRGGRHGGPVRLVDLSGFQATWANRHHQMIELPDDLQPLHTVPDPDWELIEHLASRAHRTGDIYRNRVVTADRALQIMELDGEMIEVIVNHLWHLQPEAMALSLEALDVQAVLEQRQAAPKQRPRQQQQQPAPPADPPICRRVELVVEALSWRKEMPTVQQGLDWWHRRDPACGLNWRDTFRFAQMFELGETAIKAVADAVGVDPAEVRQHAAWLAARDDLQRRQVAAGYDNAQELLADAEAAGGWGELSWCVGVAPWQLSRRCCELTDQS